MRFENELLNTETLANTNYPIKSGFPYSDEATYSNDLAFSEENRNADNAHVDGEQNSNHPTDSFSTYSSKNNSQSTKSNQSHSNEKILIIMKARNQGEHQKVL